MLIADSPLPPPYPTVLVQENDSVSRRAQTDTDMYDYLGCYADTKGDRVLGHMFNSDVMTIMVSYCTMFTCLQQYVATEPPFVSAVRQNWLNYYHSSSCDFPQAKSRPTQYVQSKRCFDPPLPPLCGDVM